MALTPSGDRLRFLLNRFRDRLWVKPLAVCLRSIAAAFVQLLALKRVRLALDIEEDIKAVQDAAMLTASNSTPESQ
jgi:hypothetical protein